MVSYLTTARKRRELRRSFREVACLLASKLAIVSTRGFDAPVFIVGTGRCGTTLLVRILESNPKVLVYPSEANALWHPKLYPYRRAPKSVPPIEVEPRRFTQISLASWPANHHDRIRHVFRGYQVLKGGSDVFIVKSAMISFMIPEILEIYPGARFLHIFRSGPPVVESYLKKNFAAFPEGMFSEGDYRLYCARYWSACILEIERVEKALSLRQRGVFLEFGYEELCEMPTAVVQELAKFLGVDQEAFSFDLSTIESKNYKVGSWTRDKKWERPLKVMQLAMESKGYI